MQGAAWKLTALAGSLAIGFFGLMQVQQELKPKQGDPFEEQLVGAELTPGEEQEVPFQGSPDAPPYGAGSDPFFQNPPAQSDELVEHQTEPQQFEPLDNGVPQERYAAMPTENVAAPNPASSPNAGVDPFAAFRNAAVEQVDSAENKIQEVSHTVQNAIDSNIENANSTAQEWQSQIVQTANEVQAEFTEAPQAAVEMAREFVAEAIPPQAEPVQFPTKAPALPAKLEVSPEAQQLIELTRGSDTNKFPSDVPTPADAPAPFRTSIEAEPKPIAVASEQQFEPAPATASPFDFGAPATSSPEMSPEPEPTSPAPATLEPTPAEPSSPEPATSEPLPFTLTSPEPTSSETAASPVEAGGNAPAVPVQPEMATSEPAAPEADQPFFSNSESKPASNPDDPYRLVPEFNPNATSASPMPAAEPAPFQLTPPDQPEPAPTNPAPVPDVEPEDPFANAPPVEPPPVEMQINPFSAPGANSVATEPETDDATGITITPAPATPTPSPFSAEPAPFKPEEPPGRTEISITPKPVSVEPEVVPEAMPTRRPVEEHLIGSARVGEEFAEAATQPRVELHKSAPDGAVLGQPLIYSIEIENSGDVTVKDVRVEDKFPAGTRLTGTIPRAELVDKTLVWKFDELQPKERKKILVRVVPIESGDIGSVSTVSYKSTVATRTRVTAPKLELSLSTSEKEVALNETIEVRFLVKNSGAGVASDVVLRNLIPVGLEHPAGADLEYEVGDLGAGQEKEVKLTMVAKKIGLQENIATVRTSNGVTAESKSGVNVIESVLTLGQAGPTRRFVGHTAKYTTTIRNNSRRTLRNVEVVAQVPNGFNYSSASSQGQYDGQTRNITWVIPELNPLEQLEVTSQLVPSQVGTHTLIVRAQERSGHHAEVSSAVKVEGFPSLAVRIPDIRGPAAIGERVSLRFKVVNRGSSDATQVVIECKIPGELEYVSANGPVLGNQQGNIVRFQPIGRLAPDAEASFDLVFNARRAGDGRVEFDVKADQITSPLKHQEQVVVYGE